MKGNPLRELDEPSAALRILLEASRHGQGINVSKLYEVMNGLGVGRTAVDSSRRALVEGRLVEEGKMRAGKGGTLTLLFLTTLGCDVVGKIREIEGLMDQVDQ